MAGHDRHADLRPEAAFLQEDVGAADPARLDAYPGLPGTRLGDGALGDPQRLADPGQLDDAHRRHEALRPRSASSPSRSARS